MKHNVHRLFIALLFFMGVVTAFALPENYLLRFSFGPLQINQLINPVTIDLTRFNIPYKREFRTQLGLDLSGGTQVTLEADMANTPEQDRVSALESAKNVIERRVNFLGVSEPLVQTAVAQERYRVIVELPGVTNVNQAVSIIGTTAQLEFREFTNASIATNPAQLQFMAMASPSALLSSTKETSITGKDLRRAQVVFSTTDGAPQVSIQFTPEGAKKFAEVTKKLVGQPLPIFLDGFLISSPVVNQEISGGDAVISGQFDQETAKSLAVQLNAGALPVPVKVVEQRVIEASLGKDSIQKSVLAGFIGLSFVALFMIVKYRWLGFLSVCALVSYGLISMALYRIIPITLTLPGIAGFILSVGMAVDSNILIFERFKEEKRLGKPWRLAMEQSFGKAWDSIRDANVTTLITCLILFNPMNWQFLPTSGLVRGYAVTLFLGVLTSLFTGLIVTRTFIRVLYREKEQHKK
jgi:preprotein translocase subunit SecD